MGAETLESYLATVDDDAASVVTALDEVIRETGPSLQAAVRYKILMYGIPGDWQHWVCAVDAARSKVCLRFLYGHLLEDPLKVLRAGSSTLMTWDLPRDEPIDAAAVRGYVTEALGKYELFRAEAQAEKAAKKAAKAAATQGGGA